MTCQRLVCQVWGTSKSIQFRNEKRIFAELHPCRSDDEDEDEHDHEHDRVDDDDVDDDVDVDDDDAAADDDDEEEEEDDDDDDDDIILCDWSSMTKRTANLEPSKCQKMMKHWNYMKHYESILVISPFFLVQPPHGQWHQMALKVLAIVAISR